MIPFIDLVPQQKRIRAQLEAAMLRVLDHGGYIMGPEVHELEKQLSAFCGARHTLSCSNGTDAIALILRAKNVGQNDAIFVPSFTFAATAEVVAWMGATVVFIDVLPDTFNIDPTSLEKGIQKAKQLGLKPCGIIPVDLYGQAADYDAIHTLAEEHGLWVIADAAQSFGGTYKGRNIGTLAESTAISFYPSKPLGAYGDAGAIFTENEDLLNILHSLRVHGQGEDKYENIRIGMNGRCDTLQAAILIEKLSIFQEEIGLRQHVAMRYSEGLGDSVITPFVEKNCLSVWAQYTIKVDPEKRSEIMAGLKAEGIPTMIHYALPLHHQKAYNHYPCATDTLPVSEALANCVLSLPMHPYLESQAQDHIINCLRNVVTQVGAKKAA
ncbi:MAG TPA: DegT/DnrJ/EryC1/StrS aminotransferase family protein [Alphaproteobacteria bacterium]|nr:DegT/DnrJ/EryC1/StrS aminotransferase family protein [Alphaproteobacteria bacterium]